MANMTANIVRNIVAASFKIDARKVILSGEINPETSFQDRSWNGSMGEDSHSYAIFGWCAEAGFVNLNSIVGTYSGSNYAHSQLVDEPGKAIYEIEGVEKYLFFFIIETVYSNWEGSQFKDYTQHTLYKAPNFQEYKEKIEAADVARWERWLADEEPKYGK
jgi:hypothetical protein